MKEQQKNCSKCRRSIISEERRGSLTSFLLSDLSCCCGQKSVAGGRLPGASDASICRRCRKVVPALSRPGSMTAFFFKDMRCQCKTPQLSGVGSAGEGFSGGGKGAQPCGALATRYSGGELLQKRTAARTAMRTRRAGATEAAVLLAPGAVIGGCYKLLELAGQGGMGSVYRARHTVLGRQCAVKFLAPSMVSEQSWRMFQKEAKIISALQHHTICQVYDLGLHEGSLPYYVMDFIHGETLAETIDRQGPLSVGAALELFVKVCEGLSYAHRRGVVHKDLKPANIMLTVDGADEIEVKILDFGISDLGGAWQSRREHSRAKVEAETVSEPDLSEVIGSAAYMSPEQFRGRDIDRRSDIYSLGCALFETLSGVPPFTGDGFEELEAAHRKAEPPSLHSVTGIKFPTGVEAILSKCLEKSTERRYQSVNELSIDIERVLAAKPLQFAREKEAEFLTAQVAGEKVASNRLAVFLVLGLTIAIVLPLTGLGALLYWMQQDRSLYELLGTKAVVPASRKVRLLRSMKPGNKPEPGRAAVSEVAGTTAHTAESAGVSNQHLQQPTKIESGSFFRGIEVIDGIKVRRFEFPDSDMVGYIGFLDESSQVVNYVLCKGEIQVASDVRLVYRSHTRDPQAFAEALRGFRDEDLFGLELRALSLRDGALLEQARIAAMLIPSAQLVSIDLVNPEGVLGTSVEIERAVSLKALQDFKNLRILFVDSQETLDPLLIPELRQLEFLRVSGFRDVGQLASILAKPAAFKKLAKLSIVGARLKLGEIKRFAQVPGLVDLSILGSKLGADDLENFIGCYSSSLLRLQLALDGASLNGVKPATIAGLTSLQELDLFVPREVLSGDSVRTFRSLELALRDKYPSLKVRLRFTD